VKEKCLTEIGGEAKDANGVYRRNKMTNECIIVGGGSSIKQADFSHLKHILESKFTILTNYSFKHFNGTFLAFYDRGFYYPKDTQNPNIYEELKTLPLIIGINHNGVEEFKLPNTILLKKSDNYERENAITRGWYTGALTGIFALNLVSFLLNYNGIVYLLGFDWTKEGNTHYYDDVKHRGINKTSLYKSHNPHHRFKYFSDEKELKIYNVSLQSNIEDFEKISYEKMYESLSKEEVNQEELRIMIKSKLLI
jgi:hypothetical protein